MDVYPEVLADAVSFSQTLKPSPPAQLISRPRLGGSYNAAEQMFFGIWFGLFLWVAVLGGVGFLFAD